MAAFDRVPCGNPGIDSMLDHIRIGDNVVWEVSTLDEFSLFAEPFVRQAVSNGRHVIYVRFAQHPPVLSDLSGVEVFQADPDVGFESFAIALHEEITRNGREAFYVFDCLSELQSVWYTDLMMGNFFCVTCPYLFELDTVAFFPLLRGRHSLDAIARIRATTQVLIDVFTGGELTYVHPLKVWNRNSTRMFMPHGFDCETGRVFAIGNGVGISRYYQTVQEITSRGQDQKMDSYDRFFDRARADWQQGTFDEETEDMIVASTMTRDDVLKDLVKHYFSPDDYFRLRDRMIGSGAIGGKACGMLLARKIAHTEIPEFAAASEPHDSFYLGSDVFYTYLVANGDWSLRVRQRTPEGYFPVGEQLRERLLQGTFPSKIRDKFLEVLEHFGQSPFIVRSSSFLEDGFGNAFAGKYTSVFCANQGSPQERMEQFEQAVRTVYASVMDYAALEYRRQRGLEDADEQMAVLVQRVSGSYFGHWFMPGAAGVGYSMSAYRWLPDMDPTAGMLRLVIGLGTRAVDRAESDYPRLVNLDRPTVTTVVDVADRHRFSQHSVDAIDCEQNSLRTVPLYDLLDVLPPWYRQLVLEHDTEAERRFRERGQRREVVFASCQRLLEKEKFTRLMADVLATLQRVYGRPVDIEYAVNFDAHGDFVVNLLQCRALSLGEAGEEEVTVDEDMFERALFDVDGSAMCASGIRPVDVVVTVDPLGYYTLPYRDKFEVARAVGRVSRYYRDQGLSLMLLTPGRMGTSSPELGVPVGFGEIASFSLVCEVADDRAGYNPDLSYGSHMFQDLVENEIGYVAILNDRTTRAFDLGALDECPDVFAEICPDAARTLAGVMTVRATDGLTFAHDATAGRTLCGFARTERAD